MNNPPIKHECYKLKLETAGATKMNAPRPLTNQALKVSANKLTLIAATLKIEELLIATLDAGGIGVDNAQSIMKQLAKIGEVARRLGGVAPN